MCLRLLSRLHKTSSLTEPNSMTCFFFAGGRADQQKKKQRGQFKYFKVSGLHHPRPPATASQLHTLNAAALRGCAGTLSPTRAHKAAQQLCS